MPEINANFVVQPLDITIAVTETNLTLEPDPVQLNIFTEGFAPPGGANTELQYNDSGTLDGVPGTSWANNKLTLVNVANLKIPGGSNAFYLQTDGTGNLSFVAGTGNVTGNGTAAGANTQIQFTDGSGNFVSNAGFTFSNATNTFNAPGDANIVGNVNANNANLTGNIIAVNANFSANINANNANITNNLVANVVKTDNLQYANGNPYDFTLPGGILHNIQFNDGNGNFGGDNAFIFNPNGNFVGLTGNFESYNANISVTLTAGNVKTDNLLYANGTPWDFEQPGGNNTEIQFNDNGNLGGSNAFTFNKTSNVVDINGNLTVNFLQSDNANLLGGTSIANLTAPNANITNTLIANIVKTNNLQYSNGTPYDFDVPGGILHNIQFNDGNGNFGGDNAFIFNPSSNFVGLTGNFQSYNANITTQLIAGNANVTVQLIAANANITGNLTANTLSVTGNANVGNLGTAQVLATANITAPQLISNVSTGTAPLVVTSTTQVANLNVARAGVANTVNDAAQPNITSVGTLTSLAVTGNITAGNITNANLISSNFYTGTLTTNAQPNITSVGTLTNLTVTGNTTSGNFIGRFANGTTNINIPTINGPITFNVDPSANDVIISNAGVNIAGYCNVVGNVLAGLVNAGTFQGNGINITSVRANQIFVSNAVPNVTGYYLTFVETNSNANKALYIDGTDGIQYFPDTNTLDVANIDTIQIKSGTSYITFGSGKVILSSLQTDDSKVTVGLFAGYTNQGSNSIAIGANAAPNAQANNSIVINASGSNLFGNTANALFVKPIRSNQNDQTLVYNTTTSEITYTNYPKTVSTTVASLTAAATVGAGTRAFVTDANTTTFNATVGGGGANSVPVFSDGTDWRIG